MNDNRQRNGDSDELSFPCSRPTKLAYLSIAQRQRNRRTARFAEDDADVGTAPGQLVATPSLARRSRFCGRITSTCGSEARAVVDLGRQYPVWIERVLGMPQPWRYLMQGRGI